MKSTLYIIVLIFLSNSTLAQTNALFGFDDLVNKTWLAEGNWGDGTLFKQEITFKYDLQKSIIITNSKGFIDKEQTKFDNRNHGIRQFNKTKNTIEFWEFDVFGGCTTGTVKFEGKNIHYTYQYNTSLLTEIWQYVDDKTYTFTIGSYKDGVWKQKYLETIFKLKE